MPPIRGPLRAPSTSPFALPFASLLLLSACGLSPGPSRSPASVEAWRSGAGAGPAISDADVVRDRERAEAALSLETRDWRGTAASASGTGAAGTTADTSPPTDPLAHRVTVDAVRVPLESLLFLLADDVGVELEARAAAGGLAAPVTLRLRDRPLRAVLDALDDQVDFDWRLDAGTLVVRDARAFSESYAIDYLNLDRTTRSSVGLATRVGTLSTAAGADPGIANSSETLIENVGEHRFWASLADDLEGLLQAAQPNDAAAPARFSVNREAGLLTVHAGPAAHRAVRRFVARLAASAQRQVLIEASVVEVTLSDRFETGIDWQLLADGVNGISAAQVLTGVPLVSRESVGRIAAPAALVSLVGSGGAGDVSATLSLLEEFGDVRILSRPRIIALNNQTSVLKVVDNRVYFTTRVERLLTEERDEILTETEIHTVPVGLVMNVTPHVGAGGTVMLNVRPTLSRILGFVDDPNPELALAGVSNGVPEIQVREMETMLRVRSGDVAIIGGLMQDAVRDNDRGVAGLARLPIIGRLFSQRRSSRDRSELLVVLRPTVLVPGQRAPGALGVPALSGEVRR